MMAGIMNHTCGDVPKWLKGADSKSARRRKARGGSNPSISAKNPDTPYGVPGFLTSMGDLSQLDEIVQRTISRWVGPRRHIDFIKVLHLHLLNR